MGKFVQAGTTGRVVQPTDEMEGPRSGVVQLRGKPTGWLGR